MTARANFSPAEIAKAKVAAESNGLRLIGYEKRPDGTVRLEFGEFTGNDNIVIGKRANA